jgi:LPXTG-motif cell wall-anchored protein
MKTRKLALVVLAILLVSVLSATGASAQDIPQQAQSGDLVLPTNTTGEFDTGNKEMSVVKPGQTDTNGTQQTLDPQGKQPRERRERSNNDGATPAETAPSSGNPTDPAGGSGSGGTPTPALPTALAPAPNAQLPKTGGSSSVASLFALSAGVLLVGGGLLARRIIK